MVIALPSCETLRANKGKVNKKKAEINKKMEEDAMITDDQVTMGSRN
jgi:hypothetical protein